MSTPEAGYPLTAKFISLGWGTSLSAAFELNFGNPMTDEISKVCREYELRSRDLVRREIPITRLYEPAQKITKEGNDTFIVFPATHRESACFMRLMFRRRDAAEEVACARFGETKCFGFSTNVRETGELGKTNYLPLAYPGRTGIFTPLFMKVKNTNGSLFLEVMATDDTKNSRVVVRVRERQKADVPPQLQLMNFR